jgi:hypothetical protein
MSDYVNIKIATKYLQGVVSYSEEISDSRYEAMTMKLCIQETPTSFILTGIIILDNEHRFKDDPDFGKLLKWFWQGELIQRDRKLVNRRLVARPNVHLPNDLPFPSDLNWSYACPTNKEHNAISARVLKNHILKTYPPTDSYALPPEHDIVIEGDFQTSSKKKLSWH